MILQNDNGKKCRSPFVCVSQRTLNMSLSIVWNIKKYIEGDNAVFNT